MEGSAPGTLSPWGKSIILFSRGVTALFFVSVEEERVYIARIVTFTTLIDCFTSVCARGTRLLVSQLIKFNKATKLPVSAFDPAVRMALAPFSHRNRAVKEILLKGFASPNNFYYKGIRVQMQVHLANFTNLIPNPHIRCRHHKKFTVFVLKNRVKRSTMEKARRYHSEKTR